jgi:hypothetical protein
LMRTGNPKTGKFWDRVEPALNNWETCWNMCIKGASSGRLKLAGYRLPLREGRAGGLR